MKSFKVLPGLFVALLLFVTAQTALAQSTIFNIPSTDTVDKGKGYFEFDFLPQMPGSDSTRIYTYNPRLVAGVAKNVEAGVNFPTYHTTGLPASSPATLGYIQPNIKWKYFSNDDAGVALAGGILWNTPLNHRSGQDSFGLIYTEVSKKVKSGMHGPRFHAGPYGVVGANVDDPTKPISFSGPRAGAILGYEQPVQGRVSFVADWFSGKNNFGYFTPGVSIAVPGNGLFNAGYSFGNNSFENSNAAKNRYLFVYYGVTF